MQLEGDESGAFCQQVVKTFPCETLVEKLKQCSTVEPPEVGFHLLVKKQSNLSLNPCSRVVIHIPPTNAN